LGTKNGNQQDQKNSAGTRNTTQSSPHLQERHFI
jgi:hypothetical protein